MNNDIFSSRIHPRILRYKYPDITCACTKGKTKLRVLNKSYTLYMRKNQSKRKQEKKTTRETMGRVLEKNYEKIKNDIVCGRLFIHLSE